MGIRDIRYTIAHAYRTEFQGPKSAIVLYGQPNIEGKHDNGYHIVKIPEGYIWVNFFTYKGYNGEPDMVMSGETSLTYGKRGPLRKNIFDTALEAAQAADYFQGDHKHISVLDGRPKPFYKEAQESWEKLLATYPEPCKF